jgi:hypothetical protein
MEGPDSTNVAPVPRDARILFATLLAVAAGILGFYLDGGSSIEFKRISPSRVDCEYVTTRWRGLSSDVEFDLPDIYGVRFDAPTREIEIDTGDSPGPGYSFPGDTTTASKISAFFATSKTGRSFKLQVSDLRPAAYTCSVFALLCVASGVYDWSHRARSGETKDRDG